MRLPANPIASASSPTDEAAPLLADCQTIMRELGVKRATAERIMRWCSVKVPLGRRVYVYRAEVLSVVRAREVRESP